jgi:hypothetical protein
MTAATKRKGNAAERECAGLLSDLLGYNVKRRYNLGTHDDTGDLVGLPNTVIQVADWKDVLRAMREKPLDAEVQRELAGADYAATFLRLRGGMWRVCQTPEQWTAMWRETR